ncbi:hypothetical protein WJX81_008217 [Elliptochloris bilobata]|uniref:Pentacotripeptide-repeat region of PRORP domain-containing protein n=1 Tax=Elliptochloris bilobata TaxID=381761 RepID=A0AAW1QVI5_9CHLO
MWTEADVRACRDVLWRALRRGDLRQALQAADAASAAGAALAPGQGDALLQELCHARWHGAAWRVYRAACERGGGLRYATYQALISSAFQAGEPDRAVQAFRGLQRSGLQPNLVTWCGVISALSKQRRRGVPAAARAHELWRELQASGLAARDAAACAIGMNACIGVGRLDEAAALLDAAVRAGVQLDARAYNVLLKGHARARDPGALAGIVAQMRQAQVQPSVVTYNTLVDAYTKAGWRNRARGALEQAQRAGARLDAWSYSPLVNGCCQAGDLAGALAVVAEMRAAGVAPNVVIWATLVDGAVRAGDLGAGEALLADMRAAGCRPNDYILNSLLRGYCCREGRPPEDALRLLRDMRGMGVAPTAVTFNTLMDACLARGAPAAVPRLFRALLGAGLAPDAVSYTTLVAAFARLGRPDDAVRAFGAMEADAAVVPDGAALGALADALARAGRMDASERALARALALADVAGLSPPVEATGAVLAGYARLQDTEAALGTLQRFVGAGGEPDGRMFDTLVDLCVRTGEFKRAMQVVRAMERLGAHVDKARIKRTLDAMIRRQQLAVSRPRQRPEALERLKAGEVMLGFFLAA